MQMVTRWQKVEFPGSADFTAGCLRSSQRTNAGAPQLTILSHPQLFRASAFAGAFSFEEQGNVRGREKGGSVCS